MKVRYNALLVIRVLFHVMMRVNPWSLRGPLVYVPQELHQLQVQLIPHPPLVKALALLDNPPLLLLKVRLSLQAWPCLNLPHQEVE